MRILPLTVESRDVEIETKTKDRTTLPQGQRHREGTYNHDMYWVCSTVVLDNYSQQSN